MSDCTAKPTTLNIRLRVPSASMSVSERKVFANLYCKHTVNLYDCVILVSNNFSNWHMPVKPELIHKLHFDRSLIEEFLWIDQTTVCG